MLLLSLYSRIYVISSQLAHLIWWSWLDVSWLDEQGDSHTEYIIFISLVSCQGLVIALIFTSQGGLTSKHLKLSWGCSDLMPHAKPNSGCLADGSYQIACFTYRASSSLKGTVHPKNLICWTFCHFGIQDVDVCFFIKTNLEKLSIASLAHQWILCSEWVPSEWESKQLIKTIHKKSTPTPVHQFKSCEAKSCKFVINPSLTHF